MTNRSRCPVPLLYRASVYVAAAIALGGCSHRHATVAPPPTHSLSATIVGLDTTGLTLNVNDRQVRVSPGIAVLNLSASLSSGTGYSVSVSSQPSGQTCTVTSGTGIIRSANVGNVVVTCASQAFTLGGTITGLTGAGLVLANGADTLNVNTGASRFTMPAAVAFTSGYRVTVSAQPAGLTCAVNQGSGTMSAGPVTNIAVICTHRLFNVSGSISGLGKNTGLLLANGSDALSVPAGATGFTMPTQMPYGSRYAVQVRGSPSGLTCAVAAGAGIVGAADVSDVVVTCSDRVYALGGTISGLTGSGLVLANGSDTVSVSPGATNFTMPGLVPYASGYSLQVRTQPVGETCTVSSGYGTMPSSAVVSVSVACASNAFTVGGSVTGLTATGLVLLDNGGDATVVEANAAQFTMNSSVAAGGSYSITVQTQPSNAFCSIANSSGNNVAGDVSSVLVECTPLYTMLYSFGSVSSQDAQDSSAELVQGLDGNFYGTTWGGGVNQTGAVFKMTPQGQETVLYSFGPASGTDGEYPQTALTLGADGNFYGVTYMGGTNGTGTVFKITPAGVETVLYSFGPASGADGANPNGALVLGRDGNFYGTSLYGGTSGIGTVFRVTPGGAESVLYSFLGTAMGDGGSPDAALVQGSDGNFYGTTAGGGLGSAGTVFKITPAGAETVLHSFSWSGTDGTEPTDSLLQGSDGNFYGTTAEGGTNSSGTVFRITPAGVETVLYSFGAFSGTESQSPNSGLILGGDGNFYGTTLSGGTNSAGTIFMITPAGVETVLHSFGTGTDGQQPFGSLVLGTDGSFYGTTNVGGANGTGSVFRLTPGSFYGATNGGGANGTGSVSRLTP